jgi:hypothetical protein
MNRNLNRFSSLSLPPPDGLTEPGVEEVFDTAQVNDAIRTNIDEMSAKGSEAWCSATIKAAKQRNADLLTEGDGSYNVIFTIMVALAAAAVLTGVSLVQSLQRVLNLSREKRLWNEWRSL